MSTTINPNQYKKTQFDTPNHKEAPLINLLDPRSPGNRTPITEKEHKVYAKSPYQIKDPKIKRKESYNEVEKTAL